MLFSPSQINPALQAALQDCASPSVSADSLITIITALEKTKNTEQWLYEFSCYLLAPGLDRLDIVFLERLCVDRWDAVGPHLLSRAQSPAIAALTVHCANLGAAVPDEILMAALLVLSTLPTPVSLSPLVIRRLSVSVFALIVSRYGRHLLIGWDQDAQYSEAWLSHPGHQANPQLIRDQLQRYLPSRSLLCDACHVARANTSAFAALKSLILSMPKSWHLALLSAPELSHAELTRYLKAVGQSTLSPLSRLPSCPIPSTVFASLPAPILLQALIHLYDAERPGVLWNSSSLPPDLIERATLDLSIRGDQADLLERFTVAAARHRTLHTEGFDPLTWLDTRLDTCYRARHSSSHRLAFLCRFVHWVDEDPLGRQQIGQDFLEYFTIRETGTRPTVDKSALAALTTALFRLRPSFLFPDDHIDATADRFV